MLLAPPIATDVVGGGGGGCDGCCWAAGALCLTAAAATRFELEALLARSKRNMALLCMMRWLLSCPPLGDIILAEGGIVAAALPAFDFLRSVTIAERDFCTLVLKICILVPDSEVG